MFRCCINYKKKVFMIHVALATKLQNYKKVFMIYVIHVCLDVALMEGEPVPLCDFQKISTNWRSL